MKTRNAVASLLTLVSMDFSDIAASQNQDSTASDTLKVCTTNVPIFGPGVYFDFPDKRWHSSKIKRPGNYWDDYLRENHIYYLISDSTFIGVYVDERFIRGLGTFPDTLALSLANRLNIESRFVSPIVQLSETDLPKFLEGYMK